MGNDALKGAIDSLKQGTKRIAEAAQRAVDEDNGSQINIAARKNIVVAQTTGEDDSTQHVSAHQTVRIRQHGHESRSETSGPDSSTADGR